MKMRSLIARASIAAATRSACTVSATSCTRTIAAPLFTAARWLAIEPPSRWSGADGVTELMKRLREAPTKSGRPKRLNSASRAMQAMLCSGVLPKPMPGSSTMLVARDAGALGDLERAREEGAARRR